MRAHRIWIAALMAGCVALTGCAGESAPNSESAPSRQAQAEEEEGEALGSGRWPSQVTCGQRYSWTFKLKIVNRTGGPLTMAAGDIDCYDWSGPGTPSTVMSGQVVQAGQTRTFTMEPRDNVSRNWTMGIFSRSTLVGVFRAGIAAGSSSISISGTSSVTDGPCTSIPLGGDPAREGTPDDDYTIGSTTILLWSDGSRAHATTCASDTYTFRLRRLA